MARYYNRRRFARRVRRVRRSKRSALSRVKKDIMKCNFPTKVKFMGLTERKVMFLTKNFQITMGQNRATQQIILDPMAADNAKSLYAVFDDNIFNWDKMCILGIYIKFQPLKNTWDAGDGNNIEQVRCTYNMNIVDITKGGQAPNQIPAPAIAYDTDSLDYKQVFTFNSNEAFTMYLPAPTTMCSDSPCVYRSKTWWALANIKAHVTDDPDFIKGGMIEDDMVSDEEDAPEFSAIFPGNADRPYICAGRLFFTSVAAKYNVTINYKVALKG